MPGKPPRAYLAAATAAVLIIAPVPALAVGGTYDGGSSASPAAPSFSRAQSYLSQRDYRAAARELGALVRAEPQNADAWNMLGFSNRRLRNYADAEAAYERALELDPDHLGALEYQGELFILMRRYDAAKANLKRLRGLCGACEEHADLQDALTRAGQSPTGFKRLTVPDS